MVADGIKIEVYGGSDPNECREMVVAAASELAEDKGTVVIAAPHMPKITESFEEYLALAGTIGALGRELCWMSPPPTPPPPRPLL